MKVQAFFLLWLIFLYGDTVSVGPGILSDACYLPAYLLPGSAAGYLKVALLNFLGYVKVWAGLTNSG